MRAAVICALLFAGCLEVVEHTPAGACTVDADCPCGEDCAVRDAGLALCGPMERHTCTISHDCPATQPHCTQIVRDAGACPVLVCQ